MDELKKLELSSGAWFESASWGTTLEYLERQNDQWYGTTQSSVDIDAELARKIIAFLKPVAEPKEAADVSEVR